MLVSVEIKTDENSLRNHVGYNHNQSFLSQPQFTNYSVYYCLIFRKNEISDNYISVHNV